MINWYFFDEARFGQQGNSYRIWADKNTRPRLKKQLGFKSCYLIGAVAPGSGEKTGMVFTTLDTDVMNLFFENLSERIPNNHHAIVVMDGAGFHRGNELRIPENISIKMLPPYSPELNPIEKIWQWLKEHYLGNRIFKCLDDMFVAGIDAWNSLSSETIKSVAKADWIPAT